MTEWIRDMKDITEIEKIINNISEFSDYIKRKYNTYIYEPDFTDIVNGQLNAKIKMLIACLEDNGLMTYSNKIECYLPIEGRNIDEFLEYFDLIKSDILLCNEWNEPIKREKLITEIAYELQDKYTIQSINIILGAFGIEFGDKYYTTNSKRVYVQNILANIDIIKIIKLAKKLNLFENLVNMNEAIEKLSNEFIIQQISKCNAKLNDKDFDGAITNARSLVEEILLTIEERILNQKLDYDGKIERLYKRVSKIMNMDPSSEINDSINSILRGFISIISGMANVTNKMGDRHAQQYKPHKRHAVLIVNSAMTICNFLIESYYCQNDINILVK